MRINNRTLDGRYELEGELSSSPFGVVYLARDTHLNSRRVVVKTLREANIREVEALTLIEHPHVVRLYGHGRTPDGWPFIVMQHVKGTSLRDAMRGGAMELERAARIVSHLAKALTAAHEVGVVHRDLKPENVLLQSSGGDEFAVLIDFGLAAVEGPRRGAHDTWAGTPLYMAPEQLRGRPVPASDVWALGVVAYEMVTGQRLFSPADVAVLEGATRGTAEARPRDSRPELPEGAQDVILKALNYDPAERYAPAREMGEAFLRAVLENAPPAPRPAPPAGQPLKELLRRCQELFASLDEFRSPDTLRAFFYVAELSDYRNCVGRGVSLEFDQLVARLLDVGRDYRGQALVDLLAVLASRYAGDYRGRECERLAGALKRALEGGPAARG